RSSDEVGNSADRSLKNGKPRKTIPVEHPPKFELMIDLTATMALGFEVPTACSSAPKILFAAVHESAVALFGPGAMSGLSPKCAPKRKSASTHGFISSRPVRLPLARAAFELNRRAIPYLSAAFRVILSRTRAPGPASRRQDLWISFSCSRSGSSPAPSQAS